MFLKYNTIDTVDKLKEVDNFLMDGDTPRFKLISFDTETNGLLLHRTVIIGFSFSINDNSGFYVPLLNWEVTSKTSRKSKKNKQQYEIYDEGHFVDVWRSGKNYPENVTPNEYKIPEEVLYYFKRWFTKTNLIMHNAPFDINQVFINFGVELKDQLFVDTQLLKHVIDENSSNALKSIAQLWSKELNINPFMAANQEQKELARTVIENGGSWSKTEKSIWRGKPSYVAKYAIADTFLTYGVYKVGMQKFLELYPKHMVNWLFKDEVFPLCKEVVVDMKRNGIYIDVPYFKRLEQETLTELLRLEDEIQSEISIYLEDFNIGKTVEQEIGVKNLIWSILKKEGLSAPLILDKKTGRHKPTLSKANIKKEYDKDPHWVWGYILGEEEIKYSPRELAQFKTDLYFKKTKRRYRFNLKSDPHIRWLLFKKLKNDPKSVPPTDSSTKDNHIPSVSSEVLEEHFLTKYSWIKKLIRYKKINKLYNSYMYPAVNLHHNGWLFVDMRQDGTISGRFSCSGGFNLQTLPRTEELEACEKCKSDNIELVNRIEVLTDVVCKSCGHISEDNVSPSVIKKGFINPPGYKIIAADFESLEVKCFAFVSNDQKLKDIFFKNLDAYSKVYCDMFNEEYRNLKSSGIPGDSGKRKMIKPVPLGITYGSGNFQVAANLNLKKVVKDKNGNESEIYDIDKGAEYRNMFLDAYPNLKKYMEQRELESYSQGYTTTLVGRRRNFQFAPYIYKLLSAYGITVDEFLQAKVSELKKINTKLGLDYRGLEKFSKHFNIDMNKIVKKGAWYFVRSFFKKDYNGAKNTPIQGLAGHLANRGMLEAMRGFKARGLDAWIPLQIHDEIVVYAREDQASEAAKILQDSMENNKYAKLLDIPMKAKPLIANNMNEAKD